MIVVYVFIGLVVLRFIVLAIGAALIIKPVHDCPACFQQSVKIRYTWLARLLPWYEWRWCPYCGWEGPSRIEHS
jgi:hypothetical protein